MTTTNLAKNVIYGLYCTCHDEGIRYVGQTKHGAKTRLQGHKSTITHRERVGLRLSHSQNWMRKHGLENIAITVLEECLTDGELDEAEERWVRALENLTNIKAGGGQPRDWKMPEGHSSGEKNPMYGTDRSELMSRIRVLRGPMSEANRAARSCRMKKMRLDAEWLKRSQSNSRAAHQTREYRTKAAERVLGEKNPRYGKKNTIEESRKMSLSLTPFSEDDIRDIRSRYDRGEKMKDIAAHYRVDPSTISRIANRKRFEWVE